MSLGALTMFVGRFHCPSCSSWSYISVQILCISNLRPTAAIIIIIIINIISEISKWSFIMRKQVYRYKTLIEKMYWT